ncbi:hypothetical protein JG687_00004969 [Phytophthora cactorum]|uniref:Uncharacterized protein n=1 Tax=Phytophthora cactorum TaxID=29920 RepID=A0A8T1UM76_9STRA|nr:hypothetical protein JG687_00004969 [Phytophthora cactorum]
MTMSGVFPIYKVLYEAVPVAYQIIVVAILPIVKFAAKHFLLHPLRELVDVMPVLVAFSVDFMTTLFIAVCMSTSGSLTMTILFIAADFMQSWLEFREMRNVVKNSGDLRRKSLDTVRLWACLPQSLTREKAERLQALEYLILVEYVECMVPLILLVFKSILEQLPNIVYYPGGAGQWDLTAVAFLQRKFAFSPLYQLAFVLESEMYPVQAIFFIQSLILLQFELEHFGKCLFVMSYVFN